MRKIILWLPFKFTVSRFMRLASVASTALA